MERQTPVNVDTFAKERLGDIDVIAPAALVELLSAILVSRLDKSNESYYRFIFDQDTFLVETSPCDVGTPLYDSSDIDHIAIRYGLALKYMKTLTNLTFKITSLMISSSRESSLLVFKYTLPSGLLRELRYIMDEKPALIFTDAFLHDLENIPNR